MLEFVVRLLNLSSDIGVVPMDWSCACIVPLYKGKGDKCEYRNSKGISLLSVVECQLKEFAPKLNVQ